MDETEYQKRIQYETNFYDDSNYNKDLTEVTDPALQYLHVKFQEKIQREIGLNVWDYTASSINNKILEKKHVKILSLGSGPGGTEMNIAKKIKGDYIMDCLDINEKSVHLGQEKSNSLGLNLKFHVCDLNKLELSEKYDIIFAHASLHHLIEHEHIAKIVNSAMITDSEFIVYDIIVQNGMKMWPETKKVANNIFTKLPEKYRFDRHSASFLNKNIVSTELKDIDTSKDAGFECIRSQDLYPILKQNFRTKIEIPGFAFARHFFDIQYGKNYDMTNPFDLSIINTIIDLDEKFSKKFSLKPESVFLVLTK